MDSESELRIEELHVILDKLALQTLDILEELLEERRKFEVSMREGYFEMTRSRHSMGVRSVGSLQIPTVDGNDIEPLTRVDREIVSEGDGHLVEFVRFDIAPSRQLSSDEGTEESEITTGIGEGLRKRVGKIETADPTDESKSREIQQKSAQSKHKNIALEELSGPNDPLKWFGVLVPQSLRNCQRNFYSNIQSVCKIASLQCNLESVRKEYRKLNAEFDTLTNKI